MQLMWITVTSFVFRLSFLSPSVQILLTSACYCTARNPRARADIQGADQPLMKICVPAAEVSRSEGTAITN